MKKTAVVTGSSRGIGFAIAKQLGMDGYNIVMVATGLQEKNQAALDELQALGIACAYVQANIGNQEDRQKVPYSFSRLPVCHGQRRCKRDCRNFGYTPDHFGKVFPQ